VRVDRTSSGMGLGLAIAKRLVQAHRGKIWVDSEPRRGSTFTVLLPAENV
jgi:signal transduction histidine kinase